MQKQCKNFCSTDNSKYINNNFPASAHALKHKKENGGGALQLNLSATWIPTSFAAN